MRKTANFALAKIDGAFQVKVIGHESKSLVMRASVPPAVWSTHFCIKLL